MNLLSILKKVSIEVWIVIAEAAIVLCSWIIFTKQREGFQTNTPTANPNLKVLANAIAKNGLDTDKICPMMEHQIALMYQQSLLYKDANNAEKYNKFVDMIASLTAAYNQFNCDQVSGPVEYPTQTPLPATTQ